MRGYEAGLALIDRLRASDPSSPPTIDSPDVGPAIQLRS